VCQVRPKHMEPPRTRQSDGDYSEPGVALAHPAKAGGCRGSWGCQCCTYSTLGGYNAEQQEQEWRVGNSMGRRKQRENEGIQ